MKLWNGDFLPNYFISLDGKIFNMKGDSVLPCKIGPASTCYMVSMHAMKFDARKVVWRSFTEQEPAYSQAHFKVHILDNTRTDLLAFNNLVMTMESSTFHQWSNENETWPWKRSSKGNVPKPLRVKTMKQKRTTTKQAKNNTTDKKACDLKGKSAKRTQPKMHKLEASR